MSRRTIQVRDVPYTYSPDDTLPVSRRPWGVVSALLVDEITGQAPESLPFISTTYRGLTGRVAQDGGLVGLVGIPANVFPLLQSQAYTIELTLGARGYVVQMLSKTLPANPAFPSGFTPMILPNVELHRLPAGIRGRTVLVTGVSKAGLAGASVQVTGFWPTVASTTGPAQPANMLWLNPPLYFSRTPATGILRRREITAVAGQDKTLLLDAVAGGTALRLSNGIGVALGTVLWVDADDGDRMEYMTVEEVAGASTPDQPATVTLSYPLAYTHRASVRVCVGNVGPVLAPPAGFTKHFTREALPGDEVAFLDNVTGVGAATVVEVTGIPNPREFHRFRQYEATSNAGGYFSLPPVSRVAQLRIEAAHPPQAAIPPRVATIAYGQGDNRVDFVFR